MPTTIEKISAKPVPTSLKLPAELKVAIDETARKAGLTSHAFMLKALADTAERARQSEQFQQDSLDALEEVERTGLAYRFEDVRAYFAARARGEKPNKPKLKPWPGAKAR